MSSVFTNFLHWPSFTLVYFTRVKVNWVQKTRIEAFKEKISHFCGQLSFCLSFFFGVFLSIVRFVLTFFVWVTANETHLLAHYGASEVYLSEIKQKLFRASYLNLRNLGRKLFEMQCQDGKNIAEVHAFFYISIKKHGNEF